MPKLLLLANPRSGTGDATAVERELAANGASVEVIALEDDDAAARAKAERFAVAGGDGSIGPAAALAGAAGVSLAVIPVGTANDFARAFGIPAKLGEACRLAVRGERTRPLELGRMNGRPFVNVVSAGLPPAAAHAARGWKRRLGRLAYALGALRAGLTAEPVDCGVICDNAELFSGRAWQATVACSGAFGAGSRIEADPGDGRLETVVFAAGSRAALVRLAYGLRTGALRSQRGTHTRRAARVRLELPPKTRLNIDGELSESGPVELSAERAAFELVVP